MIARAVVRDLYSGTGVARFFSFTILVNGLAPILAPVIGGQMLAFTTWRGVFVLLTVIGAGLLLLGSLGLPESLPAERRTSGGIGATFEVFRSLLSDRLFVGYVLSSGLVSAAMFSYISGSPFVLEDIYGVSPQLFSFIFASNAFGIVVAGQISGRLVGRVQPRRLLVAGLITSLVGGMLLFAAVTLNMGLAGILPTLFLVVSSVGLVGPNATALALAGHPRSAGSASALLGVLQYTVGAAVAPLVGIAGTGTALPMGIVIVALSLTASILFVPLVGRASSQPEPRDIAAAR